MNRLFTTWTASPARRRFWLAGAGGALIVAALGSGWLVHLATLHDVLMAAAAVVAGSDIALRALYGLRHRQMTIELLVTLATAGALAIGEYWEAAAVTVLFMLGGYLETRMLNRTRQTVAQLLDLAPDRAIVLRDGEQVEILPEQVQRGETVLVKPGTRIPVDGEVIRGRAAVDESAMTGEPLPVEKAAGARVYAGTVSRDGLLWLRASGVGGETTLARIITWVEEAQEKQAPAQQIIDRFARWYTPAIVGLSGAVFLATHNIVVALTLLVIGCPGALVIAAPVSVVTGIGRAAQRGILIKGGVYLDTVGKISTLAFDKTGTLTKGKPHLAALVALPAASGAVTRPDACSPHGWSVAEQDVLRWAAVAESGSEHTLARPILAAAGTLGPVPHPDAFAVHAGRGVHATFQQHSVGVGTREFMAGLGVAVDGEAAAQLARLKEDGATAALVALDGNVIGILGINDLRRETAPGMIRRLHDVGVRRITMVTGDDRHAAETVAREIGIDEVHAALLPQDKVALIQQMQQQGDVVAMVGDGINDAPALAATDVGIAMGAAGTAIAVDTADVVLMADDLLKIPEAIRLSRATLRTIGQNLAIAVVTAGGLLIGVALGKIQMAGGMLVHELSVLAVILNGMRLLRA